MILNLRDIPDGYSDFSLECDLGSVKNDLPPLIGKLHCKVAANRLDANIFLEVHYSGLFAFQCSRCLEEFNLPISGDLSITLKEAAGKHGSADEDESVDFFYDADADQLDVSAAIYDEIMIETPIMPLCSKDCKGVQISDKDISVDFDGVKKERTEIDPRWEALRKLKGNT